MAFTTNYDKLDEQKLKPEGEYECVIQQVRQMYTRKLTEYLGMYLSIRDDVQNPCQGEIFHQLWRRRMENMTKADEECGGYSSKQIQSLSKAAGLPNGKSYESLEDWCADLEGCPVRVVLEHDTYNGRTRERVKWFNESKVPAPIPSEEDMEDLGDDSDVPF